MQGQSLIVTGSTGIAAAIARVAAARGACLIIASADEQSAWELGAELGVEPWVGNLTRPDAAAEIVDLCVSRYRRVDALCSASGLSGRRFGDGPVHEITDEGWEVALDHNLRVSFQMCRAAIARMLQQEPAANGVRGSIVTFGSVLADSPDPRHFANHAYAAAKGAVTAMTRSMASYYATYGIRVNLLAPGLVRTAATERAGTPGLLDFVRHKQPLTGGMIDAEAVARAALFLLSEDAGAITGEALTVDGGWSVSGA